MNEQARLNRILLARLEMVNQNPFLGFVAQRAPIYFREDIKTAATNGRDLYFSAEFVDSISDKEILFVLYHEVMHIVLNHVERGQDKNKERFNIACDIVINDTLRELGILPDQFNPVYGRPYHISGSDSTAEEVYQKLPIKVTHDPFDNHVFWGELEHSVVSEFFEEFMREAQRRGLSNGSILDSLFDRNNIDIKMKKRRLNLQPIIEKYFNQYLYDYSYQRLDYRHPEVLMPNYNPIGQTLNNVWIIIDVSRSMDTDALELVFSEMIHLCKHYAYLSVEISFFSTTVSKPVHIASINDLMRASKRIRSTGGTSFDVVFQSYHTHFMNKKKPEMMIICTDGKSLVRDKKIIPNIPILWLLTEPTKIELPGLKIQL